VVYCSFCAVVHTAVWAQLYWYPLLKAGVNSTIVTAQLGTVIYVLVNIT
jgi:hypothetical protein